MKDYLCTLLVLFAIFFPVGIGLYSLSDEGNLLKAVAIAVIVFAVECGIIVFVGWIGDEEEKP